LIPPDIDIFPDQNKTTISNVSWGCKYEYLFVKEQKWLGETCVSRAGMSLVDSCSQQRAQSTKANKIEYIWHH
jgi:hypothetical protein